MYKTLTVATVFACILFNDQQATASTCGGDAAAMLRNYGPTQQAQPGAAVAGSASSSTVGELTGSDQSQRPLATVQQEKVSGLVKDAIAADGTGDTAGCRAKLAAAKTATK